MVEIKYAGVLKQLQNKNQMLLDPDKGEVAEFTNLVTDKVLLKPVIRGGIKRINNAPDPINRHFNLADKVILQTTEGDLLSTQDFINLNVITHGLTGTPFYGVTYRDKLYLFNKDNEHLVTDGNDYFNYNLPTPDVSSIKGYGKFIDGKSESHFRAYALVYMTEDGQYSKPSKLFTTYCGKSPDASVDIKGYTFGDCNDFVDEVYFDISQMQHPDNVQRILVFGSSKESTASLFYIKTIDVTDTYFTDKSGDLHLDLSWYLMYRWTLRKALTAAIHKNRLFLGNVEVNKVYRVDFPIAQTSNTPPSGYHKMGTLHIQDHSNEGNLGSNFTYTYRLFYKKGDVYSSVVELEHTTGNDTHSIKICNLPAFSDAEDYKLIIQRKGQYDTDYQYEKQVDPNIGGFVDYGISYEWSTSITEPQQNTPSELKSAILFSEIGAPQQLDVTNIIQITPDDGDYITGLVSYGEDLLIFKQHSIYMLHTSGAPENWQLRKVADNIGSDNPFTIQVKGNLVFFTYKNEVFRFPDRIHFPLSKPIINSINNNPSKFDRATLYSKYNWYLISAGRYIYVYDFDIDNWYVFAIGGNNIISEIAEVRNTTYDKELFIYSQELIGKYDEEEGTDFDASFLTQIKFNLIRPSAGKLIRPMEIDIDGQSSVSIGEAFYSMQQDRERIDPTKLLTTKHRDWIQLELKNLKEFNSAVITAYMSRKKR